MSDFNDCRDAEPDSNAPTLAECEAEANAEAILKSCREDVWYSRAEGLLEVLPGVV
jgi:hypothetical protein